MSCKIALIDSGVDLNLYGKYVTSYIDFCENIELPFRSDENGHGTLCCSALLAVNPKVEIIAVKVLNKQNKCSSERLILALEQLIEKDVNIINLSVATDSVEYLYKYKEVANKLLNQGKMILASTSNRMHTSVLADIQETIGINGKMFLEKEEYWYQKKKRIQCVANATPILLKGINGYYEMFGGNSKATAILCGIISMHWEEIEGLSWREKERVLESYAKKNVWKKKDFELELYPSILKSKEIGDAAIYKKLEEILAFELEMSKENIYGLHEKYLLKTVITKYNAISIIQKIENEFSMKINYSEVDLYWFYSIESLYNHVFERGGNIREK